MSKIIVITGVTSGVGLDTAKFLINKGYIVIGLSRNLKKLKSTNKIINNENFSYFKTDIRKYKSVKKSFDKIKIKFNKIDVLINNASIFKMKEFKYLSEEDINNIIDTNLKGTIFCTLECLKLMSNGSRIINIGSVSGIHGIENQSIYSASKYGVNGFSESLNQEIIKSGIKISSILPGGIDTPLWNENNIYAGDTTNILKTLDIAKMINYIIDLPNNIVLKNVVMFPECEWH